MTIDKNTLERRIIFKAIREPNFLDNLVKNRIDLFKDNEELATIYASLKDYYADNGPSTPSKPVLTSYLNGKLDRQGKADNERYELMATLDQVYDYSEADQKVYDSKISDYLKREQLLKAIKTMVANEMTDESINKFERDYSKIQLTSNATGMHEFYSVFSEDEAATIGNMIREVKVNQIPTGISTIDEASGGGLGRGELGAIAAASGNGKSMYMTSLANGYIAQGMNVLYIALEELNGQMFQRITRAMLGKIDNEYPSILSSFKNREDGTIERLTWTGNLATLIENETYAKILKSYEKARGNKLGELVFTRYSPNTVTIPDLRQIISNVIVTQGKKIDVILIDYPDLLEYDESMGESASGGRLYEDLRAITQEFNTIMWSASQLNRAAPNDEGLLTVKNVSGSYRKVNAVELWLTVNTKPVERDEGYSRIYVDKARHAPTATQVFSLKVDKLTANVRAETEQEKAEHEALLTEKKEPAYQKNLSAFEEEDDFVAKINHRGV